MGYARHIATDVTNAALTDLTSLPSSQEYLILANGILTGGAAGDNIRAYPNGASPSNTSGLGIVGTQAGGSAGVSGGGSTGWNFVSGGDNRSMQVAARLVRDGVNWLMLTQGATFAYSGGNATVEAWGSEWPHGGASLNSIRINWAHSTAGCRFSGRVEVWYRTD